jgi:hypothetical protein
MTAQILYPKTVQQNWKESLKDYRAALQEATAYQHTMSEYERMQVGRELSKMKENIERQVVPAAAQEFSEALDHFMVKDHTTKQLKAAEIQRWDGGKLAGEMQVTNMRLDTILQSNKFEHEKQKEVQDLLNEAKASNDLYKQRATAESLLNLSSRAGVGDDDKMRYNRMVGEAKNILEEIRKPPALTAAEEERQTAAAALYKQRQALDNVAKDLMGNTADVSLIPAFREVTSAVNFHVVNGQIDASLNE